MCRAEARNDGNRFTLGRRVDIWRRTYCLGFVRRCLRLIGLEHPYRCEDAWYLPMEASRFGCSNLP